MKAGQLSWTFLFLTLGVAAAQSGSGAKQDPLGIETKQPGSSSTTNASRNRHLDLQPVLDLQPLSSNAIPPSPKRLTAQEFLDAPDISQPVSSNPLPDFGTKSDAKLPDFGPAQRGIGFVPDKPPDLDGSSLRIVPTMVSTPQNSKRVQTLVNNLIEANAESQRRFEQVLGQQQQQRTLEEQQRALEDIARQLQLLQFQQEEDALLAERIEGDRKLQQIRLQLEDGAMRQRISSRPVQPILVSPPVVVSANSYDPHSLVNPYGAGSPYKADGLMNPYSQYGSPYSSKSWRNPYATDTPKLYDSQGNYAGKLSSNPYDPDSTANPYGRYGSPYSSQSINNPYGLGSPYRTDPVYVVPSP